MTLRSRTLAVFLAVSLVSIQSSVAVSTTYADTSDETRSALRLRSELGFQRDLAYINELTDDTSASWDFGIAMTDAEVAEVERRIAVEEELEPLGEYLMALSSYAGVYANHADGHVIEIYLTEDSSSHEARIKELMPSGATYRVHEVERTLAELNELQDRITEDRPILYSLGVEVNAIIIDEQRNAVEVGITDASDKAAAVLESRYGTDVLKVIASGRGTLTHQGCFTSTPPRTHCYGPPLRGGISVSPSGCSLAFVVNQSGVRRMLTAGHAPCGNFAGQASHHGFTFGSIQVRSWFGGDPTETADAATIGNLTAAQDDNLIYRNFAGQTQTISGAQSFAGEGGNFTCLSGKMAELVRCGVRVRTDASICFPEGCLVQQREATYEIYIGDSGGAVYNGGATAVGVQSSCIDRTGNGQCEQGDTADNALYGHIQNVFTELGGGMSIYTGN